MAIGLARMFGIRLPLNFNSPYKAENIIMFWRCWHMTLSRFLRDYLYIPLGGNRRGKARRYVNLMLTMLLGGLWHGAGWNFVIWGALHGLYLVVNHAWHGLQRAFNERTHKSTFMSRSIARLVTFVAVVVAWVFFRAETLAGANHMLFAMFGGNGISLPEQDLDGMKLLTALWLLSWFAPSTQQVMIRYRPALESCKGELHAWKYSWLQWRPTWYHAVIIAVLFMVSLKTMVTVPESAFLYFNF
jgi:D-alanyl-lipoteichoic acid acyltransferase DltB (MBOAT superfamily)